MTTTAEINDVSTPRRVTRVITGQPTTEGGGVNLTRVLGQPALSELDPFLLLDEFRSDDSADYLAGFPEHPHRGFETVTFVRTGAIDHADSLGAAARFGAGDVQWLTAGRGIVHSEMFPLLDAHGPNPLELFQIWLNLPASRKLAEPHFSMLWAEQVPRVEWGDAGVPPAEVTVIAGDLPGVAAPAPPPASWAAEPGADVAIWFVELPPGGACHLPAAAGPSTVRTLYTVRGSLEVDGTVVEPSHAAVVDPTVDLGLRSADGAELMVLQGRPIAEPVARQGPFVMTTEEEVRQAFADYRATGFGGWPWDGDEPVHGPAAGRFAVHPDGAREEPARR